MTRFESYCAVELAFGKTFFSEPRKVLRIGTDSPLQSLAALEVPQSAGHCSFVDKRLKDRFIIWRTDGSTINLEEYSTDQDLLDSTLAINFSQSLIVPGTKIILHNSFFVLFVPTQSAIHRFFFGIPVEGIAKGRSILSFFYDSDYIAATHDFHSLRVNGIAVKADISISPSSSITTAAVCMADNQLTKITFYSLTLRINNPADEVVLQGSNVIDRLFKKHTWPEVLDVVVMIQEDKREPLVCSASRDGKLRLFISEDGNISLNAPVFTTDILNFVNERSKHITDVRLKAINCHRSVSENIFMLVQVAQKHWFSLLEVSKNGEITGTCLAKLETSYIIDFAYTQTAKRNDKCFPSILALINLSTDEHDSTEQENGHQPYILMRHRIQPDMDINTNENKYNWESVQPATANMLLDLLHFKQIDSQIIRHRIFDGNAYSFDVVNRALQIICKNYSPKKPKRVIEHGNWMALNAYLDEYLDSFMEPTYDHLTNMDCDNESFLRIISRDKEKNDPEKFWLSFLKTCNELQEPDYQPFGIWTSDALGLIGVIQTCRYTVCIPVDDFLQSVCRRTSRSIFMIISTISALGKAKNVDSLNEGTVIEIFANHIDNLYEIVQRFFTEHMTLISDDNMITPKRQTFLNSSFTVELLASALQSRIIGRLQLADLIQRVFALVPQISAVAKETHANSKLTRLVGENDSNLAQIVHCYAMMWTSLSAGLVLHFNQIETFSRKIDVAQAYFKFGAPNILKNRSDTANSPSNESQNITITNDKNTSSIEDDDINADIGENNVVEMEDDSKTHYSQSQIKQSSDARTGAAFIRFVNDSLSSAITSLWPESKSMALPIFLSENRFFDALKNYCQLNEPFTTELAHAFGFFQGLALSGLKRPDEAWDIFSDLAPGIIAKDFVLNSVLDRINICKDVLLINDMADNIATTSSSLNKPAYHIHTLVEFYYKIMLLYKTHGHTRHAVRAGEKAISCANNGGSTMLSAVYTTLFSQLLLSGNYRDAMRVLLQNPDKGRQLTCLHQLVWLLINNQKETLVNLYYAHLTDEVAEILEARCHSESVSNAHQQLLIYDITYSFYVNRCNYSKAAQAYYNLSRRLKREVQNRELLQYRCRLLATILQTLQVADLDNNTLTYEMDELIHNKNTIQSQPTNSTECMEVDEKVDGLEGKFVVAVSKEEIARELLMAEVRLALIDANPLSVPPMEVEFILRDALKYKLFDMAWIFAKEFELKPYGILEAVTLEAIHMDNLLNTEQDSEWTVFNRQFMGDSNSNYPIHWRSLISYTDMALRLYPHDSKILRTIVYTFLKYSIKIPTWLETRHRNLDFGDYLLILIEFGDLKDAYVVLMSEIEVAKRRLKEAVVRRVHKGQDPRLIGEDGDCLLPFTHIDMLLYLTRKSKDQSLLKQFNKTTKLLDEFFNLQFRLMMPDSLGLAAIDAVPS